MILLNTKILPKVTIFTKLFLFATIFLITSCKTKPYVITETDIIAPSDVDIFIVSHGKHTGIIVPASFIQNQLPQLKTHFGQVPYLEIGWGDQSFYEAEEITSLLTVNALFWPTSSVLHVVAVTKPPHQFFKDSVVRTININKEQYALLSSFIINSFTKINGHIIPTKIGLYPNSQFYAAEGSYHVMNTCNKWTAKGLKSAEFDIYPIFKVTSSSVMDTIPEE